MKKMLIITIITVFLYSAFEFSVVFARDYYCSYRAEKAEQNLGTKARSLTAEEKKIYSPEIVSTTPYFTEKMNCRAQLYGFSPIINFLNSIR